MKPIMNALKATYYFFAGDAILLVAVLLAFGLATLLARVSAPNVLVAVIFIALIVGGLMLTLGRELLGRKRGG
jgi:uncharacterized membrane protein